MTVTIINIILLCLLVIAAIAVNQQRNLFAATMLSGIYSLLSASLFVCLDAVDVAFTEASVGAGIATILFLGTLALTGFEEKTEVKISVPGLMIVLITGGLLIYGLQDIPAFGDANTPVQTYLAGKYISDSTTEIGIPNLVTSVLASYRGYDTFGETTVIFTAGIGVLMLLGRGRKNKKGLLGEKER
jgi:multicomponent Na+:H+ antiporter subunit B